MSAAEGQTVTIHTLQGMHTEEEFLHFALVERFHELTDTDLPVLPRKWRAPWRYEDGLAEGFHNTTVEDHYNLQHFKALDQAIKSIKNRFNQPGYVMYTNLHVACLLVSAANSEVIP